MRTTDWCGSEYGPGDTVIYPPAPGRSINMVKATVLDVYRVWYSSDGGNWQRVPDGQEPPEGEETELRVQVQPLGSSRWEQHHGKTRYVDKPTGRGINPYRGDKHIAGGGDEECISTEARLDEDGCANDGCRRTSFGYGRDLGYHGYEQKRYVRTFFKDYVQQVNDDTQKVTLIVTENITKI